MLQSEASLFGNIEKVTHENDTTEQLIISKSKNPGFQPPYCILIIHNIPKHLIAVTICSSLKWTAYDPLTPQICHKTINLRVYYHFNY